jgi:hypothetical protein
MPATNAAFSKGIFAVATNSAGQTRKAGGICINQYFLDVYGLEEFNDNLKEKERRGAP